MLELTEEAAFSALLETSPTTKAGAVACVEHVAACGLATALSRCRRKSAKGLQLLKFQAAATASRHVFIAAARKVRCVGAEVRWRWTLKVLKTAA